MAGTPLVKTTTTIVTTTHTTMTPHAIQYILVDRRMAQVPLIHKERELNYRSWDLPFYHTVVIHCRLPTTSRTTYYPQWCNSSPSLKITPAATGSRHRHKTQVPNRMNHRQFSLDSYETQQQQTTIIIIGSEYSMG